MVHCQLKNKNNTGIPEGFKFERKMEKGTKGDDVRYLHLLLRSSIGKKVTGDYFGDETHNAVEDLQNECNGILISSNGKDPIGVVEEETRHLLNSFLLGGIVLNS